MMKNEPRAVSATLLISTVPGVQVLPRLSQAPRPPIHSSKTSYFLDLESLCTIDDENFLKVPVKE